MAGAPPPTHASAARSTPPDRTNSPRYCGMCVARRPTGRTRPLRTAVSCCASTPRRRRAWGRRRERAGRVRHRCERRGSVALHDRVARHRLPGRAGAGTAVRRGDRTVPHGKGRVDRTDGSPTPSTACWRCPLTLRTPSRAWHGAARLISWTPAAWRPSTGPSAGAADAAADRATSSPPWRNWSRRPDADRGSDATPAHLRRTTLPPRGPTGARLEKPRRTRHGPRPHVVPGPEPGTPGSDRPDELGRPQTAPGRWPGRHQAGRTTPLIAD